MPKLKEETLLEKQPYKSILNLLQFCYYEKDSEGKLKPCWLRYGHLLYLLQENKPLFSTSSLKDRHFYKFFSEKKFWLGDINDLREMFEAKIPSWLKPFEKYLSKEKLKSIEAPICQCIRIRQELHKALNLLVRSGLIQRKKAERKSLYAYRLSEKYWQILLKAVEREDREKLENFLSLPSISLSALALLQIHDPTKNQELIEKISLLHRFYDVEIFGFSAEDLLLMDEEEIGEILSLMVHKISPIVESLYKLKLKIWLKKIKRAKDASSLKEPLSFGVFAYFID